MSDTAHLRTRASGNSNPAIDESPSPALLQALEGLPDGILLLDRDWRITYANLRARQISVQPLPRLRPRAPPSQGARCHCISSTHRHEYVDMAEYISTNISM